MSGVSLRSDKVYEGGMNALTCGKKSDMHCCKMLDDLSSNACEFCPLRKKILFSYRFKYCNPALKKHPKSDYCFNLLCIFLNNYCSKELF